MRWSVLRVVNTAVHFGVVLCINILFSSNTNKTIFVCLLMVFFFKCCMQIQSFSLKFTHFVTRLIFFTIDLLEYILNFLCRFSCFLIDWIFSLLMFFSVMPIYTELKIYVLMCCNTKTRETIPFSLFFFINFVFHLIWVRQNKS